MGKGYWDDSPRFFGDSFGALMSKTMFTAVHPDEDRFLNIREMMHLMGLPHDFEIDNVRNFNHIAQVSYTLLTYLFLYELLVAMAMEKFPYIFKKFVKSS